MKRLMYIFIPILVVLLMSHNTFAYGNTWMPYTCYDIQGQGVTCGQNTVFTGDMITVLSVTKANNPNLSNTYATEQFLWAFNVRAYASNATFSINLGNGYPDMASIENIEQDCNTSNNITSCNVLVTGILRSNVWQVQLAGQINAFGMQYEIASLYFSTDWSVESASHSRLQEILTYLRNNPEPTAQDIADAVNAPEEDAVDNIDNQSTSDIDAGDSSSATNLLGNIQGIFNQINSIPVGNTCSIAADFGNLNLGNINFCTGKDKLPFPVTFGAYCFELIFVIGTSIILIRQVLSVLDWSRR